MDYVDTKRAVALGASYGGYMMNWIQGHSLGKDFKGMSDFEPVYPQATSADIDCKSARLP